MARRSGNRLASGTKVGLAFVLAVVIIIIVTLIIVATNPSSAPASSASNSINNDAQSVSNTNLSKSSTTTTPITTKASVVAFAAIAPSNPIAQKFQRLVALISNQEAKAASSAAVNYNQYIVSSVVVDGHTPVALAAFSYDPNSLNVKIFAYQSGSWSVVKQLGAPSGITAPNAANHPWMVTDKYGHGIAVANITSDGAPTFMIPLLFADNIPGSFVIQSSTTSLRSWKYANFYPLGSKKPLEVLGRNPVFTSTGVVSQNDDCNPDCASGHVTNQSWTFDASKRDFVQTHT
ncbi:MAG: hypothetical protein M0Z45_06615 [Actinomycetota bacterium]|nr:hypothetical protein [Actinomycetota bacterium]